MTAPDNHPEKKRPAAELRIECARCHIAKSIQTDHLLGDMTPPQRWAWLEQNLGLHLNRWKVEKDKDGRRRVMCNACASKPGKLPDAIEFGSPCPMCDVLDQDVIYVGEKAKSVRMNKNVDSHLKVRCIRCGYTFATETAKEAKE